MNFQIRVQEALNQKKITNSYRELKTLEGLVDFTSNDYLGLARSPELTQEIIVRSEELKIHSGATGSRLLSGNSKLIEKLEKKLATIFFGESALLFNSGYNANLGVMSTLPQRGDTIIYDELAHACIKDGARLSLAKHYAFRHNDLNDLELKLKRSVGIPFIAVESVYSMGGDFSPLADIIFLKNKYNGVLIVDEAHSTGVYGENGNGLACEQNLHKEVEIRIYTFGKAMGTHGACVISSLDVRSFLINYARTFIYTTALPPHTIVSIETAFDFLIKKLFMRKSLQQNISFFLKISQSLKYQLLPSISSIQSIIVPGNDNVRTRANLLQKNGLDVRPILSPTVKPGAERLRICLHSYNTESEISRLADSLTEM